MYQSLWWSALVLLFTVLERSKITLYLHLKTASMKDSINHLKQRLERWEDMDAIDSDEEEQEWICHGISN